MPKGRGGRLLFRPHQPQFFRIILADSLLQRKLLLPKAFAINHGNDLSNSVTLKVPSGRKWKIGVVKAGGGEVWLEEGWQQFVEYYSIVVGTFLVFRFDHSDCSFCVTIFNCSTSEIDYPYEEVEASHAPEASTEDTAEMGLSRKRKERPELFQAQPPEKMNKVESCTTLGKVTYPGVKNKNVEEKSKASDRARSDIESQNPSFQLIMPKSYVDCSGSVAIPRAFARKYMRKKEGDAVLCDLDGRTWSVQYHSYMINGAAKISKPGWKQFVKDCRLQVGDVCMFELIDPAKTMLRVVISTSRVEPVCKSSFPLKVNPAAKIYGKTTVKERTIEDPAEIKKKSVSLSSQPPSTMKAENVPHKTSKVINPEKEQEKGSISDEKPGASRTMTRSQWMKWEETTNADGETSSMFQSKHPACQVKMQKSSKSDLNTPASFTRKHTKVKGEPIEPSFPNDSRLPIGASEKSNPIFKVVITSGYIQRTGSMHVPNTFIGKLDRRTHEAKLLVGNRYWPVKLLINSNYWKGRFSGGWYAFARENCLKVGDVCCFELIDPKSVVIKVTISRAGY